MYLITKYDVREPINFRLKQSCIKYSQVELKNQKLSLGVFTQ